MKSFPINETWKKIEKKIPKGPKGPETVPTVDTTSKVKQHDTFNLDALLACRDAYIKEHGVDQMIVTALLAHQPIIDKDCITFWGDNQLLLEKLKASKAHMEGFFMKYLRNDEIQLNFKQFDIKETTEKKKLFTSGEKLEHFIQLNPAIAELKARFCLELE